MPSQELPGGSAEVLQEPHEWRSGDLVRVRGQCWKVEGGQRFPDCELVRLAGTERSNHQALVSLLWPFDRPQPIATSPGVRRVRLRRWLRALRAIVADATPCGRLRTAATARIDLRAWQLEPALAMLNGLATRVLLADEVGLGKTVQAGLIVSELLALVPAARVLVLTPAGLRDQWEDELRMRFSVAATVVDATMLRRAITELAAGTNPWSTWPVIVTSLDYAKRADVLRGLAPFTWDLLVVDEAHGCAVAPERAAAVRVLAAHARRVVLVTATPHGGDDRAFAALCGIGALAADEPATVMFRRSRSDVGLDSHRRVHLLRVRCTAEEREMHRLLERYTDAVWQTPASNDARLAMLVLRKRALSSAASLLRSLERRVSILFDAPSESVQLALPFAGTATLDEDTRDDEEPSSALAAPGLDDGSRERAMLARLIVACRRAATNESKLARLSRLIRRAREPVIVFTEYRDTARSVTLALASLGPIVALHGALGRHERNEVERQFNTGAASVLVATDAAGEGLNLHHRCRLVVNLELPWNPLRLEQRIGRVDRLGQARHPHAVHLVASSTAEQRVVERLVLRQDNVRRSLGSVADVVGHRPSREGCVPPMTETIVMERVMARPAPERSERLEEQAATRVGPDDQSELVSSTVPFRTVHLEEMALEESRRLDAVRQLTGRCPAKNAVPLFGGTTVATLSRRRAHAALRRGLRPGVVAVFVTRVMTPGNSVIEQRPCCLHLPDADLDRVRRLAAVLGARVDALARPQLFAASAIHQQIVVHATAREALLATAMSQRLAPVQPGMFDRRAVKLREQAERDLAVRSLHRETSAAQSEASGLLLAPSALALLLVVPG